MKIIRIDNFNREGPGYDDYFVASVQSEWIGEQIVKLLNGDVDPRGEIYYQLVQDSYELKVFKP